MVYVTESKLTIRDCLLVRPTKDQLRLLVDINQSKYNDMSHTNSKRMIWVKNS